MKKYIIASGVLLLPAILWAAGVGISTWTKYSGAIADGDYIAMTDVSDTTGSSDGTSKAATALQLKTYVGTNISFLAAGLSDMKIVDTTEATNGRNFVLDTVSPGDADDTLHVWSIDKLGSTFQPLIATQAVETTGTIQGKMLFNSYAEATTLTAANHNSSIVQMTVAAEVTMWDCETANVGDWVSLWARDAEKIEVVPASGDQFFKFDGSGIGVNDELDIAATAGTKVTLICTADDTWSVYSETAASTDGGAAD